MTTLLEAAKKALMELEKSDGVQTQFRDRIDNSEAITTLRQAIEQQEKQQPVAWLTKELMADYLDMIAEAIEDNKSEMLRHKAHWMRARGEV